MKRRSAILANLLLSLPMVTGLLGAAPSASAQANKMIVSIPFDFSIGNHHLAAGSYSVATMSDCFVLVRNTKTNDSRVLMVRKESSDAPGSGARLVFRREGRAAYLTQAWFSRAGEYVATARLPRHDMDYAKKTSAANPTIEVASTR